MLNVQEGQICICVKSDRPWWTTGKEYEVVSNNHGELCFVDDDGTRWSIHYLKYHGCQFKRKETPPEKKGKDAFSFTNYAKLMFSMNELPAFNDRTNGWYRRILILNFNTNLDTPEARERINEFNKQREERESKEQLGKFAWFCIQQFKKILDAGTNGENPFTETEDMIAFKKAYIESNDPSKEFLSEVPVLVEDAEGTVNLTLLKNIFNVYTKENNINKSMNWRTMKELLLKQGFEEKRTSKARVLTGLKIARNGDNESIRPYLMNALAGTEYVNIFNDIQ